MPSASRPEAASADEVVEAFHGDSLEEAMAAAVDALGPDLVVRRARKVRAGLSGLLGKDRYEVLALPDPSAPADPALALQDAFDALLGEADAREAETAPFPTAAPAPAAGSRALPPPPTPARRRPVTGVPAAAAGLSAAPDGDAPRPARAGLRRGRGALAATAPHPGLDLVDHEPAPAPAERRGARAQAQRDQREQERAEQARADRERAEREQAERARLEEQRRQDAVLAVRDVAAPEPEAEEPPARGRSRRTPARRGGWSAPALQRLGVPGPVLEHLEPPRPGDDLGWVAALARAIAAVVPDPAEPSEQHPVVLSGHGLAGALAVLDAGTRGATPGTISYGGRTAPATATELALAVRHHLSGG